MTSEESYKKYICVNCKNKTTDLCEIRRRYDNTVYCNSYDSSTEKKKKMAVNWQKW